MTSEFSEPFQNLPNSGFDFLTAGTQPSEVGVAPAQRNTLRVYDQKGDPPWLGRWEIELNDFSLQGFNHPEGLFSKNANGFAWSDLVTHRPNEMGPPPQLRVNQGFPQASADFIGLHSCWIFDRLFLAIGDGADASLFKETSATDPTPTAVTFTPTTSICSLSYVLDDGAARLAVGRINNPVLLISDATGTVATTMHSSTNYCWGIILSGVSATGVPVMLIYAGTTIGTKSTDADLTTAITTTVTGINAGGFAIGSIKPAGRAQRAYWAEPLATNTAGALKHGDVQFMRVWSTDMTGNDHLPSDFDFFPFGIIQAAPFRDGILMTDGRHVGYWDGDTMYDLGIFRRRVQREISGTPNTTNVIDSDERKRVVGLVVNGPECGVIWQWYDQNATLAGKVYFELYNFESGSWHSFGPPATSANATGAAISFVLSAGALPLSPQTRSTFFFDANLLNFKGHFIPRAGESLLWENSLGASGTATDDIPVYYADVASMLTCRWWLDGIKRNPKVITEVEFGGNLDHGGAGVWTFRVRFFGRGIDGTTTYTAYDQTFTQGQTSADYIKKNRLLANIVDLQGYFTTDPSGAPRTTVELLPITIRGAYIKRGVKGAPSQITESNAGQWL